jgi:hypothetical protein
MALHNIALPHPAMLVRHAFCPHIVHTRSDIMPHGAVETCGSMRWRQRLMGEKGGQPIIRRGEPRRQIPLPREPQRLAPELLEKLGSRLVPTASLTASARKSTLGLVTKRPNRHIPN